MSIVPNPDWGFILLCPVCGYEYSHHGHVYVFERVPGEDGPSVGLMPGRDIVWPGNDNPSPRRNAVRIYVEGECDHRWTLDVIQHKGNTFLTVTPITENGGDA